MNDLNPRMYWILNPKRNTDMSMKDLNARMYWILNPICKTGMYQGQTHVYRKT